MAEVKGTGPSLTLFAMNLLFFILILYSPLESKIFEELTLFLSLLNKFPSLIFGEI